MVTPWRDLAAGVDAAIDEQFGEAARLVPMRASRFDEEPTRDPDREPIEVIGCLTMAGDQALGLAGDHAGSPMIERIAVSETNFSVTEAQLGTFDPRKGDRLVLLDAERGGKTYEINRAPPAATGRRKLYLIEATE